MTCAEMLEPAIVSDWMSGVFRRTFQWKPVHTGILVS